MIPDDRQPIALGVDRCVCANVTFAQMQRWLDEHPAAGAESHAEALDRLRAKFACGEGCALCVPYVRAMLESGVTVFAPGARPLRDDAV
jgi:hypothetical protein